MWTGPVYGTRKPLATEGGVPIFALPQFDIEPRRRSSLVAFKGWISQRQVTIAGEQVAPPVDPQG